MLNLKKYLNYYLLFFINVIYILLRIPDFYRPLWSDELISLRTTLVNPLSNPLYDGVSTNLPLYYYLIKLFSTFFSAENLRITSLIVSIIILNIFLYRYIKEKELVYFVASILLTFSPIQIYYSTELRTYILTELLLVWQFFYLKDYLEGKKVNLYLWGTIIFLSLVSHYTAYIFVLATILVLIYKEKRISENLIKTFFFPCLAGLFVLISISGNQGFTDSTDTSILNLDFSRFSLLNIQENFLRLVEVLTVYYHFGLHYYRLDGLFTSLFKKFMYFFLLVPLIWTFIKNKFSNSFLNFTLSLLSLCLIFAIIFDLSGFIIFAGRYIFPFHFIYLILIALVLAEIYKFKKILALSIIGIFLISYNLYNNCLYQQLEIYRGNNDPQGKLVQSCFK